MRSRSQDGDGRRKRRKSWAFARRFCPAGGGAICWRADVTCGGPHAGLDQRARRPRRDRLARTHPLQALDDHLVAHREPVDDGGYRGRRLPELNPALLGLVVGADREDIIALLVGQHGGARDRQHLDRLHALQHHGDEFAVGKLTHRTARGGRIVQRRIGDFAAYQEGVGALCDGVVDEVQLAGLVIKATIGQADLDHDRAEAAPRRVALAQLQSGTHRDREYYVHRILADDGRQHARSRGDHVTFGHRGAADLAVDGRTDIGVVEVDLGRLHLGLGGLHLGLQAALVGERRVVGRLLTGGPAEQGTRPVGGQFGVFERRLQLRYNRLLRRKVGLERTPFEKIELISLLDLVALFEQPLFQKRGDARDHVDPVDRLDPSEKFAGFGNRSLDRFNNSYRWRPAWSKLRPSC